MSNKDNNYLKEKNKTISDIINTPALELHQWYFEYFQKEIPSSDEIDLREIGDLLSEVGNYFVYFSSMHSMLDTMVKEMKLNKQNQEFCKEIMIKRDIIGTFEEQSKFIYNAISRMCTTRIEGNKELNMLNH